MISQRLRGVTADGEALEADFVPKLKKAFADVGVAIEDENGELRSTFDILQDLAERWDDLDSKQRQYLGEKAAGNRQVKVLNAIMANWDVVQDTIDKANEATGMATEGNEKYLDSIQGRITAFQSAFQNLARTTIDSAFVKGVVSLGTAIVNITTKLGGLVPVLTTISGLVLLFKGAKIVDGIKAAVPALAQLFASLSAGVPLLTALKTLLSTPIGIAGGILALVGVFAGIVSAVKNAQAAVQQNATTTMQEYTNQQQKVASLNDELKKTEDLIQQMSGRKLTIFEEGEKERLEQTNAELQRQIALEQKRLEISERAARQAAGKAGKQYGSEYVNFSPDLIEAAGGNEAVISALGIESQIDRTSDVRNQLTQYAATQSQELVLQIAALDNAKTQIADLNKQYLALDPKDPANIDALNAIDESRKEWQGIRDTAEKFINDYLTYLETTVGDLSKVDKPEESLTSSDKAFNALYDLRETLRKTITDSQIFDMDIGKQFEMTIGKYPQEVKKIKKQIEEQGQGWGLSDLIKELTTIDDTKVHQTLGDILQAQFGDVDFNVLERKVKSGADMLKAGWEEFAGFEDDIVTYYSQTEGFTVGDVPYEISFTPITPDGEILSEGKLNQYLNNLFRSSGSIDEAIAKDKQKNNLLLHFTPVIDGDESSAILTEEIYTASLHAIDGAYRQSDLGTSVSQYLSDMFTEAAEDPTNANEIYSEIYTVLNMVADRLAANGNPALQNAMTSIFGQNLAVDFTQLGWSGDQIRRAFLDTFDAASQSAQSYISILPSLIEENFMATESYKNLTKAMSEQEKAGVISMETYQALMDDEGLPGIQNYLTLTAEGFALNTETMYDYIKAMNDEMKVKILDELAEKQAALEKLKEAMEGMTDEEKAMSKEASEAEKIQNDITALQAYANSLDSATGALERYRAAKKTANEDEDYTEGQGALKDLKSGWKSGKTGTDDYQSAMGFFLANYGSDPNLKGKAGYNAAQKVGNRYFADEKKGANNFLTDLQKLSKSDLDVASKLKFSEDGKSLEIADDTSIQEIAQGLSEVTGNAEMSEDAVASLFKLLKTYDEDNTITFPWLTPPSDPETDAQRKELETSKSQTQDELDKLTQQREELLAGGANISSPEIKEIDQQIEQASQAVEVLDEQLSELGSDTSFQLETSSIDELQKKLDGIQATIAWLRSQGAGNIPLSLEDTATKVLEELDRRITELETGPNIVDVTAEDKTIEGVESAEKQVKGFTGTPATVDLDATATGAQLGALEAQGAIDGVHQDEPTAIRAIADSSIGGVGKQLDDAARNRTSIVTLKVVNPGETIDTNDGDIHDAVAGTGHLGVKDSGGEYRWSSSNDYLSNLYNSLTEKNKQRPGQKAFLNAVQADIDSGTVIPDGLTDSILQTASDWIEFKNQLEALQIENSPAPKTPEPEPLETNEPTSNTPWGDMPAVVDVPVEVESPDEVIEEVQAAADSNPVEITVEMGSTTADDLEPAVSQLSERGNALGYTDEVNELTSAYEQLKEAQSQLNSTDPGDTDAYASASQGLVEASSNFQTAYDTLSAALVGLPDVEVDANTSSALAKIKELVDEANTTATLTVNIKTVGEVPDGNATGTNYAKEGPSLVDEKGAELIEHTKRGTYELGTNKGARMTYLDRGDVVHTASETKTILSRMAKVGGFFRNGLNKAKSIIGGAFASGSRGISGSFSLENIRRVLGSSRSKVSGNSSSGSNNGSKKNAKKFQSWAEKLFDWAEIRLARLQTITNGWLLSASEAIGYMAKNKELTNAIASVEDQIEATTKAYDLYMKEADIVQKKAGLSDAIVRKIQSGDISIGSYKKEVQEKIKQYQEWYRF